MKLRTLRLPALLFLLASSAAAQEIEEWALHEIPWEAPQLDFSHVVSGKLLGEEFASVCQLASGVPFLLIDPTTYNSVVDMRTLLPAGPGLGTVLDVAVLPDGVEGGHDSLLTVGSAGLVRYDVDASVIPMTLTATALDATAWLDAKRVRVADLNADGKLDVFGLDGSGYALIISLGSDTGLSLPIQEVLLYPASDLVSIDYAGLGGAKEIAVLTSDGLYFFDHGGDPLREIRATEESGFITTIRDRGGDEFLAWVVREGGDEHWWLHCFNGWAGFDGPINLTLAPEGQVPVDLAVAGISAGDWDGDGDDDLVIAHQSFQSFPVFMNVRDDSEPSTQHFTNATEAEELLWLPLSPNPTLPAPGVGAAFGAVRKIGAGHDLILAGLQDTTTLSIVEHQLGGLGILPDAPTASLLGDPCYAAHTPTDHLYVILLDDLVDTTGTHPELEVIIWQQDSLNDEVSPTSFAHHFLDRPDQPGLGGWSLDLELPLGDNGDDLYYVQFRFVERNQLGRVIAASDNLIMGLGRDLENSNPDNETYLSQLPGVGSAIAVSVCDSFPNCPETIGEAVIDFLIVQDYIPPFPKDQPAQVGPTTTINFGITPSQTLGD